ARYYEPVLSRFTTMDPLAEKYYSISPYAYCAGNPVMYVDPDGRKIDLYQMSEEERIQYDKEIGVIKRNSELFSNLYAALES
ncbi:MAG: RHS repeat-associated core domain-containing protein, partial [Bacteroidales bacterium]